MVHDKAERKMICPACGNGEYPVLSPAVIVGVTNGDKLILPNMKAETTPATP